MDTTSGSANSTWSTAKECSMNAILVTVLALSGANGSHSLYGAGAYDGGDAWCDECDEGGRHGKGDYRRGMPQSCYNPSFGCYPSTRFMHRYPAFHNYYAREAYNYRHYFDYPWHAGLHEPTSMFSYNVPGEAPVVAPPFPTPAPVPMPDSARREPTPAVRTAGHAAPVINAADLRPRMPILR
jgi:hypothetical protein